MFTAMFMSTAILASRLLDSIWKVEPELGFILVVLYACCGQLVKLEWCGVYMFGQLLTMQLCVARIF